MNIIRVKQIQKYITRDPFPKKIRDKETMQKYLDADKETLKTFVKNQVLRHNFRLYR